MQLSRASRSLLKDTHYVQNIVSIVIAKIKSPKIIGPNLRRDCRYVREKRCVFAGAIKHMNFRLSGRPGFIDRIHVNIAVTVIVAQPEGPARIDAGIA